MTNIEVDVRSHCWCLASERFAPAEGTPEHFEEWAGCDPETFWELWKGILISAGN